MISTRPGVFAAVIAAAALMVPLLDATGLKPPSTASGESGLTSDYVKETCGTPNRYPTTAGGNTVWVATATTPAPLVNASYNCVLLRDLQNHAIGSLDGFTLLPDLQTSSVGKTTRNPHRSTTTTTITMNGATSSKTTGAHTSYQDSFNKADPEDSHNESRWRRFGHEPLRRPDQVMARFLNTLMYLAEVITADVLSALLFGRWRPRYYERARKNRIDWKRRRRFRRFRMNAADVVMTIWDGCVNLHDTLCEGQDDVSGPTYQMISNLQLTEYPVTLSTFADVPTSEIVSAVASARGSALVSIASISPPISAFPAQSLLVSLSRVPPAEATTLNPRPIVSPPSLFMLEAPETSAVASCPPRASLTDTGLDITLQPDVSQRFPLLFAAAPPTTPPSLASSQRLPEAASEEIMLRVKRAQTARCSSVITTTKGCGVGMVNTLVRYITAERSVTTPVEAFDGQADTADEPPPSPFFVSEYYTPDSTCHVSAHGVAYTRISMAYIHRFNHPTRVDAQEETPTTTQTGDVSDILWTAANAQMRCKWSQTCTQTTSSEYYRSFVEAVFASSFIPDEDDIVMLNESVRKHL